MEAIDLQRDLYGVLSGDATLSGLVVGIHADEAPPEEEGAEDDDAVPYVVYSMQSGTDTLSAGSVRSVGRFIFNIRAVGMGETFADIESIADRIDTLIHSRQTQRDDYGVTWQRVETIRYIERDGDRRYNHLGGLYIALLSGPGA